MDNPIELILAGGLFLAVLGAFFTGYSLGRGNQTHIGHITPSNARKCSGSFDGGQWRKAQ